MRVLRSNFSANVKARAYLLLRQTFLSFWIDDKCLLFIIHLIEERLIPVGAAILRGARCVCGGASSGEQISSSIKSVFSSVVTDLDRPEPSFLFMMPLSFNSFKGLYTDV